MSYLYDAMKEALGGKSFSSGTVSKNWSPNEVRAIVLMRDFLLVADYLKYPKVIPFNQKELYKDLSNPNRRGNLNNLLTDRQLSCLEEIYVDEAFRQNFQNVIDLEGYVQGLFNSRARLRYYGYVTGMNANQLITFYQMIIQQGKMDCTLAKDMGGFRYVDTENTTWYKQYNLRDQYYDLDKPKGKLHTYFAKCQQKVGEDIQGKEAQVKELSEYTKILKMFSCDVSLCSRISLLMKYSKFLSGLKLPMLKKLGESLSNELRNQMTYKGLTKATLVSAIKKTGIPATPEAQKILTLYDNCGVYDNSEGEVELSNEGILRLGTRLSSALLSSLKSVRSNSDRAVWRLVAMEFPILPECEFTKGLQQALSISVRLVEMSSESIDSLINFVYRVGGLSEEDFKLANKFCVPCRWVK